MNTKDIIKRIRHIDILTNRVVTDVLAGRYHSIFKGQGVEFSDVREYSFGDDVRSIDWNLFAKTGKLYVKKFQEERELTVILAVDVSASTHVGTQGFLKSDLCAQLSALLAFSAIRNNDKVGLILFSDQIEMYIPPKKGKTHVLRLIRDILYYEPKSKGTNIAAALQYITHVTKKHTVLFIISDFFDSGYEKALRISAKRHDVIPIVLSDPMDDMLPNVGMMSVEDPETGHIQLINTTKMNNMYMERRGAHRLAMHQFFRKHGIDAITVNTNADYLAPIIRYFKQRERNK